MLENLFFNSVRIFMNTGDSFRSTDEMKVI